jgi:hypothetical protein
MPTASAGRLIVVMLTPASTVMESVRVADAPTLSVTFAVKPAVPEAVGVPLMTPVPGTIDNPAGRLPEEIDHARGAVPPDEANV